MAGQRTAFSSSKSIAGAALVVVGTFVLYGNLAEAVAQVRHVLGANGSEALGVMPAVILATSQVVHIYALGHQEGLQCLFRLLISFWPPLLVMAGTILLRDTFPDRVEALPTPNQYLKKNFRK